MRNSKDVADFIRTMTVELTDMARDADLPALGFILTLASLEAKRTLEGPRDRARRKSRRRASGLAAGEAQRVREPHVAVR